MFARTIFHGSRKNRTLALTFDDGPHPQYTSMLLDLFNQYEVKATFFVTGKAAETQPELIRTLVAAGHEIGNHTYSHKSMIFKRPAFIREEIERTDRILRELGVSEPIHFRPPYMRMLLIASWILGRMGKKVIKFDVAPKDFKAASADEIVRKISRKVKPGSIIVLHDGGGDRTKTVEALKTLIPQLQADGYRLVTVSEMLLTTKALRK